jgi:hypothetical protein
MFAEIVKDVTGNLDKHPQWQLEVNDQSGRLIFRLSLHAETIL